MCHVRLAAPLRPTCSAAPLLACTVNRRRCRLGNALSHHCTAWSAGGELHRAPHKCRRETARFSASRSQLPTLASASERLPGPAAAMLSGVKLVDRGEAERLAREERQRQKKEHKKDQKKHKKVGSTAERPARAA